MAAQRYYYSDTITDFRSRSIDEIVGRLTLASQHDINDETSQSWVTEIETLREVLAPYSSRGSVYMEYNIPRMGRRADVIVVIDGIVFVLEELSGGQSGQDTDSGAGSSSGTGLALPTGAETL